MRRRSVLVAALAIVVSAFLSGAGATDARLLAIHPVTEPTTMATGDFNGDGLDDLATGVPGERVDGKSRAGAVHVLHGSAGGLRTAQSQFWHQGVSGVPGKLESHDHFGRAVASGDFDADGFDDLAIGAPDEDVDGRTDAGHVVVLYGSAGGLRASGSDGWARNSSGIQGAVAWRTYFGWALATGDLDGDGFDDLAIGAPGEDGAKGAVHVLFGRASGLGTQRDQVWRQGRDGVEDTAEDRDWFGASLAAGNLGYSTREADLAIGAPGESVAGKNGAGAVHVLYGQPGKGPSATLVPDAILHHELTGVAGDPDGSAWFASALAVADFGRSTQADLAVGSPGTRMGGVRGSVSVFYGGSYGVRASESELWHHDAIGIGAPEDVLRFGESLVAADFNGFSQADLAIGAPNGDPHGTMRAGSVLVLYGSALGLRVSGSIAIRPQLLTRRTFADVQPRVGDGFGSALAGGNFGKGPGADLAIAAPQVDTSDSALQADAGEIYLGYGESTGLSKQLPAAWNQNSDGIADHPETSDRLGGA